MTENKALIPTAGQPVADAQAAPRQPLLLARLAGLMKEGEQSRAELPWLDDLDGEDTPTPFLFYLNAKDGRHGIIAAANLHTIKGQKKAGKSAAGLALIVAALRGGPWGFLGIEPVRAGLRILWIDTEQDRQTLRQKARAALDMAGLKGRPEELRVLPLRAFAVADRLKLTRQAIEETAPDLVFLDGVVDLCEEFNDEKPSRAVTNELMNISETTGTAILGLIHANPKDEKARGHLGTLMEQKSAEIYQVKKSGNTATIWQENSRFAPVPPLSFDFADGFRIKAADGAGALAERVAWIRAVLEPLFRERPAYSYGDLLKDFMAEAECGKNKATEAIADARDRFSILKTQGTGREKRYSYLFPTELFEGETESAGPG